MRTRRVVVIGGGPAGHATAEALLSALDETESLAVEVVTAEKRLPYNRTTVNKGLLSGGAHDDAIGLAPLTHPRLEWHLGRSAVALDPARRDVTLDDATTITADAIVLATGSQPRDLPAPVAAGARDRVLPLRTPDDTARLRDLAAQGPVVIAGAGLIGTELPAELKGLTSNVHVVDPADRPLSKQVGPRVGAWIAAELDANGTATHWGRTVSAVHAAPAGDPSPSPLRVTLDNQEVLDAAVVVACLGARPDTRWLSRAGISVHRDSGGLMVDAGQRVLGHPGLYAAGDLAAVAEPHLGSRVRIEHWGAAIEQGRAAARSVLSDLGVAPASGSNAGCSATGGVASSLPQHSTYVGSTKLTFIGWPISGRFTEHVLVGEPGVTRALVVHSIDDRVVGAIGVGGARLVNQVRGLVEQKAPMRDVVAVLDTP